MYMVPGNCTPLGWQTTEGSPGRTWQAWGGSFLLLLRRHALSSRWLWTFNHDTCENRLEEVQGSATSSLFTPPLFQNNWPCVQLLCAERNAPCQRDLAIDKAKPPASVAKRQGNDQTDLQCQTARHCHHQVQWATCAAWHWRSGPHSEGEKTPMLWTCGTLQWCSPDSLWHTGWWKVWAWEAQNDMETADREGLQITFFFFLHYLSEKIRWNAKSYLLWKILRKKDENVICCNCVLKVLNLLAVTSRQ